MSQRFGVATSSSTAAKMSTADPSGVFEEDAPKPKKRKGRLSKYDAPWDPHDWTVNPHSMPIEIRERVCHACDRGRCGGCHGFGKGRRFEGPNDKRVRLPGCLCAEQGHPTPKTCPISTHRGDSRSGNWERCGNPVKGVGEAWGTNGPDGEYPDPVPMCGFHLAMMTKREERVIQWKADSEARQEQYRRDNEQEQADEEYAEMLNAACQELGIEIKAEPGRAGIIKIDSEAGGSLARYLMERV